MQEWLMLVLDMIARLWHQVDGMEGERALVLLL